jgi:hypothetical protein
MKMKMKPLLILLCVISVYGKDNLRAKYDSLKADYNSIALQYESLQNEIKENPDRKDYYIASIDHLSAHIQQFKKKWRKNIK